MLAVTVKTKAERLNQDQEWGKGLQHQQTSSKTDDRRRNSAKETKAVLYK